MAGRRLREAVKKVGHAHIDANTDTRTKIRCRLSYLRTRMCMCVCQELQSEGEFGNVHLVIAGLSNVYTHYITTYEEYQVTPESHSSSQMHWQLGCGSQ